MDPIITLPLITIFICLLMSAFFSSSETAITAVSRARIYHLILEGDKRAIAVGNLRKKKEKLISGLMIGNNIVNILAASVATDMAIRLWGENGVLYATVVMTIVVVIFSEVLPKTLAIQNSEKAALALAPAVTIAMKIIGPFNAVIQFIIRNMVGLFGGDISKTNSLSSAEDVIRGTIELHHHEGQVVKHDRDMLGSILDMQNMEVAQVMIHRLAMETIDIDDPLEVVVQQVMKSQHSRIPFWQGEPDNIIGILHVKALLKKLREGDSSLDKLAMHTLLARPWFIPETTSVSSQLHAFRVAHQHMALVVDEYGALQGLITLEDIIEEIVGRIQGEQGMRKTHEIAVLDKTTYVVRGSMSIRDVNRELGWELPDEQAATIAGLVIHEAQLIPDVGQQFEFHNVRFTVLDKQVNQVTRLKMEVLNSEDPSDDHAG
jgi:Mg2+/Co2+ transporter CorB